jgi:hypothetical protein
MAKKLSWDEFNKSCEEHTKRVVQETVELMESLGNRNLFKEPPVWSKTMTKINLVVVEKEKLAVIYNEKYTKYYI